MSRVTRRLPVASRDFLPRYVVWELTLKCDLACTHCGSRAGPARDDELSTDEALGVVEQLAEMGAGEVVLIGGEAYLHEGFLAVCSALRASGIRPTITTGGRGVDQKLANDMAAAGIERVSVSIDGLEANHDRMRALRGSFRAATLALAHCKSAGITITANTNFNRLNRGDLEPLYEHLRDQGIVAWQVQLTTPLGRAADRTAMMLQPWDLLDLVPRIAAVKKRAWDEGITVMPGNNLGYFGPEEAVLRSIEPETREHWNGCQAGRFVLGIESDGAVKGCPSLQTAHYVGGNLRKKRLREIWERTPELGFARNRTRDDLWGFCRECPFAATCRGGCSFTAHALLGRPGNNPYCHFRARHFAQRGLRERLVPARAAQGKPFDNGTFDIAVEPLDAPDPDAALDAKELVKITRKPQRVANSASEA
jgi:radical SAM protein with 4Fe4S-binding SPASM domain